jgi:protein phosphatase
MKIIINMPQTVYELGHRKNQEDYIFPEEGKVTSGDRLFIVCDGMGGYEQGEVASQIVATTMARQLNGYLGGLLNKDILSNTLEKAYEALDKADKHPEEGKNNKMGTTLALLAFSESGVFAMHMGDSRIYHFRPETRELRYRSRDHSLVQQFYDLGDVEYRQMKHHPQKNVILRALRPNQEQQMKAEIVQITDVKPGDYFMIGSDGMFENADEYRLMEILANKEITDREKRDRLVGMSEDSQDNHSAFLIGIDEVKRFSEDELLIDEEARVRASNPRFYQDMAAVIEQRNDEEQNEMTADREGKLSIGNTPIIPIPEAINATRMTEVEAVGVKVGKGRFSPSASKPREKNTPKIQSILILVLSVLLALAVGIIAYLALSEEPNPKPANRISAPVVQPTRTATPVTPARPTVSEPRKDEKPAESAGATSAQPIKTNQTIHISSKKPAVQRAPAKKKPTDGKETVEQALEQLGNSGKPGKTKPTTQSASDAQILNNIKPSSNNPDGKDKKPEKDNESELNDLDQ